MRTFIAINFDAEIRGRLMAVQRKLSACGDGNFTRPENLHLTVLFLGETKKTGAIRRAMDACFIAPVALTFDRVGTFRSGLYWAGGPSDPALDALHTGLVWDLSEAGFSVNREARLQAHVTLAREAALREKPDLSFEPFFVVARRLSLMKSERIDGKLTYTEIYAKRI